ncbi:GIY-YIG nuclease family protein [Streptomyces sp. NPDC001076]
MPSASVKEAATAEETPRPAAVYRLWDAAGNLLYIGSSYDPQRRYQDHRDKPWWPQVARCVEEWRASRIDAYRAELKAIAAEDPRHNVYGTDRETEAMRQRTEMGRVRGAVQRGAYRFAWNVLLDANQSGLPSGEAHRLRQEAFIDYLDASGVFPAYVKRLRDQQRPEWATNPTP